MNRAARRLAIPTAAALRAESLYLAFCALASGREHLRLVWASSALGGRGGTAAALVHDALAAGGVAAPAGPAADPPLASARTLHEALRAVARLARAGSGPQAVEVLATAHAGAGARAASALARGRMEAERRDAVQGGRASPHAGGVPDELTEDLGRALPDEWSPSQLEAHARCPYRLFLRTAVGLPDREAGDLDMDPRDEGSLAHAVLERFLRSRVERGEVPLRGSPGEVAELRDAASALFARFEADGRVGDPAVWSARRAAVLARLERVVAAEARAADGLVPALLELRFGGGSGHPPLVLAEDGEEVRLRGRLDRVDAGPDRLLLIDYKSSRDRVGHRRRLEPGAMGVTNFQVPAYLMAAARALPGRARLEATYLLLGSGERLPPFSTEAGAALFSAEGQERAPGERSFASAVVTAVRGMRRGSFPIVSRDCTGCAFGAVCRFEGFAEGEPA